MSQFEDIRSVLQRPASQETWAAATRAFDAVEDATLLREVLLPYAQGIVRRWPIHVRRRAPRSWFLRKNSLRPRTQPHPLWSLVDTFFLEDARPQSSTLAGMLQHAPWTHITGIEIERCYIDTQGARRLCELPATGLDLFRMSGNHTWSRTTLRGAGAQPLISSGLMDGVTHLEISNHNIGNRAARDLFERDLGASIRTVHLRGNRLGGKLGVRALTECTWLPHVTHLDLSFNHFTPESAEIFAQADNLSNVTWLSLWGNRSLQLQHLERLLPRLPRLTYLDLSDTGMPPAQVASLGLSSTATDSTWDAPHLHNRPLYLVAATSMSDVAPLPQTDCQSMKKEPCA